MADGIITQWNGEEDDRLQGLTSEAKDIYLRGLRRHMNYRTGIVETTKGVCKRVIEFIPDAKSKMPARRVANISDDYIRARWQELVRVGLIKALPKRSRFDKPQFFLPLATIGEIRPKYEPPVSPQSTAPSTAPSDIVVVADVAELEPLEERQDGGGYEPPENGESDTTVLIPSPVSTTELYVLVDSNQIAQPRMPQEWSQFFIRYRGFQLHQVSTVKSIPLFKSWIDLGVEVKTVIDAMEAAEVVLGRVPDTPMYYKTFVESIIRESAIVQQEGSSQLSNISNSQRGNRNATHKRSGKNTPVSRAIESERQCEEYYRNNSDDENIKPHA